MTKSRTALPALALLAIAWPRAAFAQQGAPASAQAIVAAYGARIRDAMGSVDGVQHCPRAGEGEDAIIVCGRNRDASMRLPLPSVAEEGSRHRLIAGEPPSATAALGVGRACCGGGGGVDMLGLAGALARGAGRILHPN